MRIKLEFEMTEDFMPLDYHKAFISFIKKSLSEYNDGIFYDNYYNEDIRKNSKKDFSWSIGFSKPIFKKDFIEVTEKKLNMIFVTQERINKLIFFEAFNNQINKEFKISEKNNIILKKVRIIREREFTGNVASFKVLSPIILRLHEKEGNVDRYVSSEDADFEIELKRHLIREYPSLIESIDNMKIDKSNLKKIVVKIFDQKVNAAIGNIFVMADNVLLKRMYLDSVGSRKSAGFGVLGINDCWEVS